MTLARQRFVSGASPSGTSSIVYYQVPKYFVVHTMYIVCKFVRCCVYGCEPIMARPCGRRQLAQCSVHHMHTAAATLPIFAQLQHNFPFFRICPYLTVQFTPNAMPVGPELTASSSYHLAANCCDMCWPSGPARNHASGTFSPLTTLSLGCKPI